MRILVAYDGSDPAKRALERAATLGGGEHEITVLSVVPVLVGARGGAIDPTSDVADHRRMLDEAAELLAERDTTPKALEAVGQPEEVIVTVAEKEGFELVVLGSHGHGLLHRLLGSTTNHVVAHAPCDVLVVR